MVIILIFRGCDNCSEWFHGDCINLRKHEAKKVEEWYCQSCLGKADQHLTSVLSKSLFLMTLLFYLEFSLIKFSNFFKKIVERF